MIVSFYIEAESSGIFNVKIDKQKMHRMRHLGFNYSSMNTVN